MVSLSDSNNDFDILIIGGSLSGSTTALQILRRKPKTRICIVEKSTTFSRRVGESTVEVGAYFLGKHLGLTAHLDQKHIAKQGLRFHFANEKTEHLRECGEIGPGYNVRMPSYQIDRAVLDEEMLSRAETAGATVRRGWKVREVELCEGEQQSARCEAEGNASQILTAKWIVDASGRATVIGRKLGLIEPNKEHPISAVWARFRGVLNWEEYGRLPRNAKWAERTHGLRGTATNHLMGDGYWIWMIPLASGETSVGVVYDERIVSFPTKGPLEERLVDFIRKHPAGKDLLARAEIVEGDLHHRRKLSYRATQFAGNGWVLVGDAAGFLDPFYSPGLDWLAFTSNAASRLTLSGLKDSFTDLRVKRHNEAFASSYDHWFRSVYKDKYFYMGELDLMDIAFRSDLGSYYAGVVKPLLAGRSKNWNRPPFSHPKAQRAARFLTFTNARFVKIAARRRKREKLQRKNHDSFRSFRSFELDWTLRLRLFGLRLRWLGAEVGALFEKFKNS